MSCIANIEPKAEVRDRVGKDALGDALCVIKYQVVGRSGHHACEPKIVFESEEDRREDKR